jgi:hypothetical protein
VGRVFGGNGFNLVRVLLESVALNQTLEGKVINRDVSLPLNAFDLLWLEVTSRCYLTCTHCYAHSGPQRPPHSLMQPEDWIAPLDR